MRNANRKEDSPMERTMNGTVFFIRLPFPLDTLQTAFDVYYLHPLTARSVSSSSDVVFTGLHVSKCHIVSSV